MSYTRATGLLILGDDARPATKDLKEVLNDKMSDVVCVAAEALYGLGEKNSATDALLKVLSDPNQIARTRALNVIDAVNVNSPKVQQAVEELINKISKRNQKAYDIRMCTYILQKWKDK